MERHLLDLFWPVFCIGQYVGFFPCKRIKDPVNGKITLRPINGKIQWTIYTCTMILSNAGSLVSATILFTSPQGYENLVKCIGNDGANHNVMEVSSAMVSIGLIYGIGFIVQWETFKAKFDLCQLSNYADGNISRSSQDDFKILWPFSVITLLTLVFVSISSLLITFIHIDCLSIHWIGSILTVFSHFMSLVIFGYPIFVFLALVLEINLMVSSQCKQYQQFDQHGLKKIVDFIDYLEISKKLLSPNYFYVTTFLSIEILILLFMIISQMLMRMGIEFIKPMFALVLIENGIYLSSISFYLYYINIWSQKVTNQVQELKGQLQKIFIPHDSGVMEFDKHLVPISFVKKYVEEKLEEFHGFDGNGYFILGKSFLKNLLTFIATYFVILMQFRLSQSSTDNPMSINPSNSSIVSQKPF